MDSINNFRRPNRVRLPRRTSLDGVTVNGVGKSNDDRTFAEKKHSSRGGIGDFNRQEGFYQRQQPQGLQFGKQQAEVGQKKEKSEQPALTLKPTPTSQSWIKRILQQNWRKLALRSCTVVLVVGLIAGGYLFGKGILKARQIFGGGGGAAALHEGVDPSELRGEGDGRINLLLFGKGGAGHEGADLTDTLMLASIDPIHNEAALLSIPRDLYVRHAGGYTKINAVYANAKNAALDRAGTAEQRKAAESAGLEAVDKVVEDHLGIPVHYHVMVDFAGFERAINEVGGIEVNAKEPIYEVMHIDGKRYVLDVKAGRQHLDGTEALAYARSRMSSARGDFARGERQRLILLGLKDKVLSSGTFADPRKISGLMDAFGGNIQANLTLSEVLRLYEIGKDIDTGKIASIGLSDPPHSYVRTATVHNQSVVVPTAGINDYSEIRSFVRNALKDGFIRNENAVIAVYNGTEIPGLAGRKANDLKSYGYNVSTVADAPTKGISQTVLVDVSGGHKKYTRRYLEQRLNVTATDRMPSSSPIELGEADFVIILGQDERYNY